MMRRAATAVLLVLLTALPALAHGVEGALTVNPDRRNGAHITSGRILLYSPGQVSPGSSISHWDVSASPDLLMEPFISSGLPFLGLDVTPGQMMDVGWEAGTSNLNVHSFDPPDSGFLDPRPFPGAPGNDAATLGEARQNLFAAVLGTWGNVLGSDVDVDVIVLWVPLPCGEFGAALAGASTTFIFYDDEGQLPRDNTWYHAALTEALAGEDLTGPPRIEDGQIAGGDIVVFMNSEIDNECLAPGTGFYYGLDGAPPPNRVDVAPVVLHEVGHGLGFSNFTDETTGQLIANMPGIFDVYTLDETTGKTWDTMSNEERAASATRSRQVSWTGEMANALAADTLATGAPELVVTEPDELAGAYEVGTAAFGPPIPDGGLAGEIACMVDGLNFDVGDVSVLNGCGPATNAGDLAGDLAGKIALVDRGACFFTDKVRNAQDAGAVAAIVVNNVGSDPLNLGGFEDGSITIPAVGVGNVDGNRLRQAACPETAAFVGDDRFQVTTIWATDDEVGSGDAGMLNNKTTYFTYFDEENVEVTVKVLDACKQNGNFWVFAAGMTNVETILTVTDTKSGFAQIYYNPPMTPFRPIQDTAAFATCP